MASTSRSLHRLARVSGAGIARPERYCPTVGCLIPSFCAIVAPVLLFVCRLEAVINKTLNFSRKKSDGGNKDGEDETKDDENKGDVS